MGQYIQNDKLIYTIIFKMEKTRLSQSIYSDLIQDFMNNGVSGSIIRDLIMQRNIMPNRRFIGTEQNRTESLFTPYTSLI